MPWPLGKISYRNCVTRWLPLLLVILELLQQGLEAVRARALHLLVPQQGLEALLLLMPLVRLVRLEVATGLPRAHPQIH
jgi:hypothetical protein